MLLFESLTCYPTQYYWRDQILCLSSEQPFVYLEVGIHLLSLFFFKLQRTSSATFFSSVLILALLVIFLWTFVTFPMRLQAWGGGMQDCPQRLTGADQGRNSVTLSAATPGLHFGGRAILQPGVVLLFLLWARGLWLAFKLWSPVTPMSSLFPEWLLVELISMLALCSLWCTAENTCNAFFPHHPLSLCISVWTWSCSSAH